jgi:hypothetical protein
MALIYQLLVKKNILLIILILFHLLMFLNLYKIVSETIDGIKKKIVMIEFEEYNNYMLHTARSNKTPIDDETIKKYENKNKNKKKLNK